MSSPLLPTDPRVLGRYRMVARIGEGGMGAVYLARDPHGRPVAIKVIRPELAPDERFRARFRSEVNRARQVPPFCTAEVLDADPDHDPPYLVVEYVDGPSLAEVIKEQGPLTGGSLHSVAVGMAAALAAIHGAGVIHRDLKPRNVLFALGVPKVIDFGIARALEATSHHTRTEEMVGTLAYMAPERFDPATDRHVTPAADIFAWGAVVTYAGTGRTPFTGDVPMATAARILTAAPVLDGLPEPLAGVVALALAKDPVERPTAQQLLDLLLTRGPGAAGSPPMLPDVRRAAEAARHVPDRDPPPRRGRRRLAALTAGLTVMAALTGPLISHLIHAGAGAPSAAIVASRPAPTAPSPAADPVVHGPTVVDSLDLDGQWSNEEATTGSCRHDGGLVVTTTSEVRCIYGPEEVFPSRQTISVLAQLATHSCAAIYFRIASDGAYRIAVCPDKVTLAVHDGEDGASTLTTVARPTATGTAAHGITVSADESQATVTVDEELVLRGPLDRPALVSGMVTFGALKEGGGRGARVRFNQANLRSGGPAPAPAFVRGDATFDARVYFLNGDTHSSIVQPADLMTGAAFCRRHQIDAGSGRCAAGAVLDPEDLTVTLPVSKTYRLREYRPGTASCVDKATRAGRCTTTRDRFSVWATEHSPFPARVVIRDGVIVEVDELDLP
nr:serine/threonine-protein kinase [uncultured Actinoplanes sp.]